MSSITRFARTLPISTASEPLKSERGFSDQHSVSVLAAVLDTANSTADPLYTQPVRLFGP
jgi:hypothetical protein